ncbi:integrase core domain protein [Cooperia oncophora]
MPVNTSTGFMRPDLFSPLLPPAYLCSNKSPLTYWKIPDQINCTRILPPAYATPRALTINVYRPNTIRYQSTAHVCRIISQTTKYSVNFFGARSQTTTTAESAVPLGICKHMIRDKACAYGELSAVGTVWKTRNKLDFVWPSAPFQCCSENSVTTTVFAYHGSSTVESPIGTLSGCHYRDGFCTTNTGAAVVWSPQHNEQCRYILVSPMKGTLLDKVWLSESKEFALSFALADPRQHDCGHRLIITDQGYGVEIISTQVRSKRETLNPFLQQVGVATTNQLAAQLLAVEDNMQHFLNNSFHHSILHLCKSVNSLSRSLSSAISAHPTLAMRKILHRSDIEAVYVGDNVVRTKSCVSIDSSLYKLMKFNGSCFSLPSVFIRLPDGSHWKTFIDPITKILTTQASPVECKERMMFEFANNNSITRYYPMTGHHEIVLPSLITVIPDAVNPAIHEVKPALTLFHNLVLTNISEFLPNLHFNELWSAIEGTQAALDAHLEPHPSQDLPPSFTQSIKSPFTFQPFSLLLSYLYQPWVITCCFIVTFKTVVPLLAMYMSFASPTPFTHILHRFQQARRIPSSAMTLRDHIPTPPSTTEPTNTQHSFPTVTMHIADIVIHPILHFTKIRCVPHADSIYEVILGNDTLTLLPMMSIHFGDQKVSFGSTVLPFGKFAARLPSVSSHIHHVRAVRTITLPPNSESFVSCVVQDPSPSRDLMLISQCEKLVERDLIVAPAIISSQQPVLLISNLTNQSATLYEGMRLAKAIAVTNDEHTLSEDNLNSPPAISCVADITPRDPSYKVDLDHCDLNPKQRCQLQRLLDLFSDVFSKHQYDIGSCTAGKVHIFTTNDPPAKIRPYRKPILGFPNYDKQFHIFTDASAFAQAGALMQEFEENTNKFYAVAYCSRTLSETERRWPAVQIELGAIIYALRQFKPYICMTKPNTSHDELHDIIEFPISLPLTCRVSEEHQLPVVMPCRTFIRGMDHSVNMAEEQQKDEFLQKVFHFKQDNSAVSSFTDQEKASLTDFASKVTVASNGCLYYRRDNSPAPLLLIPSSLQPLVINAHHSSALSGGHMGWRKTLAKILRKYYWPSVYADVHQWCQACMTCQMRSKPNPAYKERLIPVHSEAVFAKVGLDLCGPLKITERGNRYILNMICWFTRYVISVPLQDARANTIAHALLTECVLKYGTMSELISDQASSFTSHFYQEFCNLLYIQHRCATPYHSMGNGATERTFRTFEEDWDLFLPCVTFCYNTTINEATGESPYFLLFGRDPIFVIDRILNPQEPTSIPDSNGVLDYRAQLVSALQLAWSNAADFARNYKAKMKLGYDKTARPSSIQVGDRVFFKNYTNKQGLARKLCFPWIGQFRVIQMDPPHATIVSITSPQAKPRRVHLNQIKKIFECTGPASTLPTILEEEEELVTHLPTASIKGYDHAVTHNSPTMIPQQASHPYNLRPHTAPPDMDQSVVDVTNEPPPQQDDVPMDTEEHSDQLASLVDKTSLRPPSPSFIAVPSTAEKVPYEPPEEDLRHKPSRPMESFENHPWAHLLKPKLVPLMTPHYDTNLEVSRFEKIPISGYTGLIEGLFPPPSLNEAPSARLPLSILEAVGPKAIEAFRQNNDSAHLIAWRRQGKPLPTMPIVPAQPKHKDNSYVHGLVFDGDIAPVLYRSRPSSLETVHVEVALPDRLDLHTIQLDPYAINICTDQRGIDLTKILIGDLVYVYSLAVTMKFANSDMALPQTVGEAVAYRKPNVWRVARFALLHRDLSLQWDS